MMWHIEEADIKAYESLAKYHYVGGRPAMVQRVLCVRAGRRNSLVAGALVVTYAPINAAWRASVWNDVCTGDRTSRATALNATVRRIARVVVHPVYRGLGVASALLRSYLAHPLTPRTEAVSSMAHAIPLFERCGMKRLCCVSTQTRRDSVLASALRKLGIEAWELMNAARARELVQVAGDGGEGGALRHAALAWANSSRHSRASRESKGARKCQTRDQECLVREVMFAAARLTSPAPIFVYESK